jgi:hypothetical protein
MLAENVVFPWLNVPVQVDSTFSDLTGEEHLALRNMGNWTDGLRTALERACFADYLEKIEAIGAQPPTVPVIKCPNEIWNHVRVESVRPEGADLIVVYAEPSWQIDLCHEWCIEGSDRLLYVGPFLGYSPSSYATIEAGMNSARNYDETIARLAHLPQDWNSPT